MNPQGSTECSLGISLVKQFSCNIEAVDVD
jgi:hypothetical protein